MDRTTIERELNLIWAVMIVVTSIILFAGYELTQIYICPGSQDEEQSNSLDSEYGPLRMEVCRQWGWESQWMAGIGWVVTVGFVLMLINRFYSRGKEEQDKPDEAA